MYIVHLSYLVLLSSYQY